MPREVKEPLQKVTLNLVEGDKDILSQFHPAAGWSVAARKVIHRYCQRLREMDSQQVKGTAPEIDIDTLIKDFKDG